MDPWELVTSERAAFVDLLSTLRPDEWTVPSLCPGWTVQDVVAHLVSALEARPLDMARAFVGGYGVPPRIIRSLAGRWSSRPPAELVAGLRAHVDSHFAPPVLGYRASLTDVMVHRLDVAVPLSRPIARPASSWEPVLSFVTAGIPFFGSLRGGRPRVTWRTSDLDWSSGTGPLISGPADAVGLALCGRDAWLDRLEGPGVPLVAGWLEN